MASFLRRQDDLQNLKVRNLYLQNTNGTYPADESILTISGNRGLVVTSSGITVSSLDTCELTAADGKFVVDCTTGWLDMYRPGLTAGTFGTYASSGIQLHGGITGGTTASQYLYRMYIQSEPNDISGAGVPLSSTVGVLGIADASGGFEAPVLFFDGSANKMRVIQFGTPVGNIASVTIDQNYSPNLEPHPLNVAQHCGRVSTQQLQVAGYMGVNIYNNDNGFQPLQPVGITSEFGGAGLRNNPTSDAYPYSGTAITNRYPTVITSWKPTTAGITGKNFNLITMDASAGYIGILKNNPTAELNVSGSIFQEGSTWPSSNLIWVDSLGNPGIETVAASTGDGQAYHDLKTAKPGSTRSFRRLIDFNGDNYLMNINGGGTTLQQMFWDAAGTYMEFIPGTSLASTYITGLGSRSSSFTTVVTTSDILINLSTLSPVYNADLAMFPNGAPITIRFNVTFKDGGAWFYPTCVDVCCYKDSGTVTAILGNGTQPAGWTWSVTVTSSTVVNLQITPNGAPVPAVSYTARANYTIMGAQ
jgi:hypothetical protein